MKLISSRDNPFFKELIKLSSSAKFRREKKLTLLDGAHLLAAYLDSGNLPRHILLNAAALCDDEIMGLLARVENVALTQLDDKLFSELSELKTPTGILTLIETIESDAIDIHFAVLLEDLQDPGNLGSILRSAAAAGCDAVFLSPGCADAWSPKVLRAAMGGHFALHIYSQQNLQNVAKQFSGQLFATSLQATRSLYQCQLQGDIAFMVGNEGAGLSAQLLALASQPITIPMLGKVESLNAAAATAICLFEALRQRIK
ncbi:MAG: TrmH family RNA methyltransferase [Gallionella sp.]